MDKYHVIREQLSRRKLDGLVVSNPANIRYLTGFEGSSAVLFIGDRIFFFTDFRYRYECESLLRDEELMIVQEDFFRELKKKLKQMGVEKLGFEYGAQYQVYERLKRSFALKAVKDIVEKMRVIKDAEEIDNIALAVERAERAFEKTKRSIRKGVKERSIALMLENHLKKEGCARVPFDIIVASGKNSALPHAKVSDKKLAAGDLVIIDWGGEAHGYFSDMTRTFLIKGDDLGRKKRMYKTVLGANRRAIETVREGLECREIDRSAREFITAKGFGEYFGHATGHGIGINVHEGPSVSSRSKDRVSNGSVFTIEPGIYLSGLGGVRIEDLVAVHEGKRRCLTALPKRLEIL